MVEVNVGDFLKDNQSREPRFLRVVEVRGDKVVCENLNARWNEHRLTRPISVRRISKRWESKGYTVVKDLD